MLRTSNQSNTGTTGTTKTTGNYVSSKSIFEEDKLADILFQCREKGMGLEYVIFEVNHHKMTLEMNDIQDIAEALQLSQDRVLSKLYVFTNLSPSVKNIINKQVKKQAVKNEPYRVKPSINQMPTDLEDDLHSAKVQAEKLRRERNKKLSKNRYDRSNKLTNQDSFYYEED